MLFLRHLFNPHSVLLTVFSPVPLVFGTRHLNCFNEWIYQLIWLIFYSFDFMWLIIVLKLTRNYGISFIYFIISMLILYFLFDFVSMWFLILSENSYCCWNLFSYWSLYCYRSLYYYTFIKHQSFTGYNLNIQTFHFIRS